MIPDRTCTIYTLTLCIGLLFGTLASAQNTTAPGGSQLTGNLLSNGGTTGVASSSSALITVIGESTVGLSTTSSGSTLASGALGGGPMLAFTPQMPAVGIALLILLALLTALMGRHKLRRTTAG